MTTETDNPPGYELVRRIGSGATSVVWEATQLSTGRRVARWLGSRTSANKRLILLCSLA